MDRNESLPRYLYGPAQLYGLGGDPALFRPRITRGLLLVENLTVPPPSPNPPIPTSPTSGKPTTTDFSGGAVTLLRLTLRRIEGWQCALKSGKGNLVQESMAITGCEIDDFLGQG